MLDYIYASRILYWELRRDIRHEFPLRERSKTKISRIVKIRMDFHEIFNFHRFFVLLSMFGRFGDVPMGSDGSASLGGS